jgi:AcrR family transcriptional regulator
MEGDVKRQYDSPLRRQQAAATRRRILEAAQRLFERDGFTATTMAAIASEAGVALKTVYLAFQTKTGVLRTLWNVLLRGDEEPAPVGERAWFQAVLEEPDPRRKLRLNAHNAKIVRARIGPLLDVIRDAAPTEPEIADLWARIQAEFYDNQRAVIEDLHRRKALRRGLDVARASDILSTLNHPDVYRILVNHRGWTPDNHEKWLADILCEQLLQKEARPPSHAASGARAD